MQKRRTPEIIAGRVNGDGTIGAGDGFTVQKTGTGTYQIRAPNGFRVVGRTASLYSNSNGGAYVVAASPENVFTVGTYINPSTATDLPFEFVAAGVQT